MSTPQDAQNVPECIVIDAFKLRLDSGEEKFLKSGSPFPMNAHPDTQVLLDASQIAGETVFTGTSWKSLKGMIEQADGLSAEALLNAYMNVKAAVTGTSFDQAQTDPQKLSNYLADLQIMLVIIRKSRNAPLVIFQAKDGREVMDSDDLCRSVLFL